MNESLIGAVDIGGTKIATGLIQPDGQIVSQESFSTLAEQGFNDGLERIAASLRRQLAQQGAALRGVGVGCTGPVNPLNGEVEKADNLPSWQGGNLVNGLNAALGVSVALENDADAAALGEAAWGVGHGCSRFIYLTISTGIGSGMIYNSRLYRGMNGAHPEVGHAIVDPNGPPCYCGARGCWEMLSSGVAIASAYNAQAAPEAAPLDARQVCRLAEQGDALALRVIDRAAFYLGIGLANLVSTCVPEVIALGGGVMNQWALFEPRARAVMLQNARLVPVERVQLVHARLGSQAGLVGAARVWLHRFEI